MLFAREGKYLPFFHGDAATSLYTTLHVLSAHVMFPTVIFETVSECVVCTRVTVLGV